MPSPNDLWSAFERFASASLMLIHAFSKSSARSGLIVQTMMQRTIMAELERISSRLLSRRLLRL